MQEIRGNQISIIFQDPLNSLSPVHTIGEQLSEILMLHKKMGSRKQESVQSKCWNLQEFQVQKHV